MTFKTKLASELQTILYAQYKVRLAFARGKNFVVEMELRISLAILILFIQQNDWQSSLVRLG